MRSFKGVGNRFQTTVKIVGGPTTRMIIHRPSDQDNPSNNFLVPHFMGRVQKDSLIQPGNVVYIPDYQKHYILGHHSSTADHRTLYMFLCDRQLSWKRRATEVDLTTRLPRELAPVELGTPWIYWQRERREFTDLNLRVTNERYIALTNEDVELRDSLDGKTIDRIDEVYGLKVLEIQG